MSTEQHFAGMTDYVKMMGSSFYDGIAGVLYFLNSVYDVQPTAILEKTIMGCIQTLTVQEINSKNDQNIYGKLGFHTGLPGIAYVLCRTAKVFKNPDYKIAAENLLEKCFHLKPEMYGTDIIDGIAGAIPVFLYFYKDTNKKKYLDFAIQLGDALLQKAEKSKEGLSWNTMPDIQHNLTGYGHGTAGMAHAFIELYDCTKDPDYRKTVSEIIRYENSHFVKEESNWPDFRNFAMTPETDGTNQKHSCSCAWCHGAPGIGLSRFRCYELTKEESYLKDALAALETTVKNSKLFFGFNFSLCHGLLGNSELLHKAAAVTGDQQYLEPVKTIADSFVTDYIEDYKSLPSGLQSAAPVFDFMLGESGMGYFLLRLYDAERFPNMLLFIT
jgi:lantibiotic modifying enzyme